MIRQPEQNPRTTHVCPWWLAYTFDNPLRRLFHRPEKLFAPYVRPGMTVADLGCGMGYFSIGMAKIVGSKGRVLAVDLQQKMLDILARRAARAGVAGRILPRLCDSRSIGITEKVDFVLAFWMVHETADCPNFLKQVYGILRPGGFFLVTEPRFHVSAADFQKTLDLACLAGFQPAPAPAIRFSHAAVLHSESRAP